MKKLKTLWLVLLLGLLTFVSLTIELGFRVVAWAPPKTTALRTLEDLPPSDKRLNEWMGFQKDPTQDFGIPFEDVEFLSRDGVRLSGWVLNSQTSSCGLIFVHGRGSDRRTFLRHLGWANETKCRILLFDLRNHGLSQFTTGYTTLGNLEKLDVLGALDYFHKIGVARISLFGTSLGGAAVIFALNESSNADRAIIENTYSSVDLIFRDFRGPTAQLIRWIPFFEKVTGIVKSYSLFRLGLSKFQDPEVLVSRLSNKSIFYIHGLEDTEILPHHSRLLFEKTSLKNKFLWTPDRGKHSSVFNQNQSEYRERVLQFLSLEVTQNNVRTKVYER